jgi:hypothetical protein
VYGTETLATGLGRREPDALSIARGGNGGTSTNTVKIARAMPATNKRYTVGLAAVGRLDANGKIREERDCTDRLDVFTQLGVLTPGRSEAPAGAPSTTHAATCSGVVGR